MTGTDIMEACWQILQDKEDPHEFYPGQDMIKWINEGVGQVTRQRPDSLIGTDGALLTIVAITELADTLSIGDRWLTAVVEWVLARAFGTDSEDEGDRNQAAEHRKQFKDAIGR